MILQDQFNLEFMLEFNSGEEEEEEDIEEKIQREVTKTKKQKMEDFKKIDPNLVMKNGGFNDVYQAIFQCFCSMTVFVGYFMRERHLEESSSKLDPESMTMQVSRVFESYWRNETEYTLPYVDIKFVKKFIESKILSENHCGVEILQYILLMMWNEQVGENER